MSHQTRLGSCKDNGFAPFGYVKISLLSFGLAALWGSLNDIILPLRVLDFVSASQKNTYLGLVTFTGLILAVIVQPIAGAISDSSELRWGRRRPFILLGVMLVILFLPGIALAPDFAILLLTYCLLQVSSNTAEGPFQAFVPDLVPEKKRGRASGVKSLLQVSGGLALIRLTAYLIGYHVGAAGSSHLWPALGILAAILFSVMIVTLLTVKERRRPSVARPPLLQTIRRSFDVNAKANRDFVLFLVARGLMGMPAAMLSVFALYYLMSFVGVANPVAAAANLLIIVGVCLVAAVYPAGRLSDAFGRKPVLAASGLLGISGVLSLFLSRSYTAFVIGAALLGIANGTFMSSSWALATDLVAKGEEARYLGLTNLAGAGGSALAYLMGPAIDSLNNIGKPRLGYQVMLVVCSVCFLAGTLVILNIRNHPAPALSAR